MQALEDQGPISYLKARAQKDLHYELSNTETTTYHSWPVLRTVSDSGTAGNSLLRDS